MWRLTSLERWLFTGSGQERWQHYNSETPCETARHRSIDQIVTPCSARLSHRQAPDIIGLAHINGATRTHTHLLFQDRHLAMAEVTHRFVLSHNYTHGNYIYYNIACVVTYIEGQLFAHAGGHWYTHLQRQLWPHTGFAITAVTGNSPVQLLVLAQIDYDISSSLIFLLIHSVTMLPFRLLLQSQESITELWLQVLNYWMEMVLSVGIEIVAQQ